MGNYLESGMRERVIETNVADALRNIQAGGGAGSFNHLLAAYDELKGVQGIHPDKLKRVTLRLRSNYGSHWEAQVYTPWKTVREIDAALRASQSR